DGVEYDRDRHRPPAPELHDEQARDAHAEVDPEERARLLPLGFGVDGERSGADEHHERDPPEVGPPTQPGRVVARRGSHATRVGPYVGASHDQRARGTHTLVYSESSAGPMWPPGAAREDIRHDHR